MKALLAPKSLRGARIKVETRDRRSGRGSPGISRRPALAAARFEHAIREFQEGPVPAADDLVWVFRGRRGDLIKVL